MLIIRRILDAGLKHQKNIPSDHDEAAHDDDAPPSKQVTDAEDEHGAKETSDLVDGRREPLHGAVVPGCLEHVVEGHCGDDAAHDTAQRPTLAAWSEQGGGECAAVISGPSTHP